MNRIGLAAGAIGALVVLTSCGGGDDSKNDFADGSASEIAKSFSTDMGSLKSVHIAGTVTGDSGEIELDLALNTDSDCEGDITISGGTAQLLSLDGDAWMKPDEAFWRAASPETADQIIATVGDKWVVVPPSAADLTTVCDLGAVLDSLLDEDNKDFTKAGTEEVDGQSAVKLTRPDTDDPDATTTSWIAVEGKHYLLKFEKSGGAQPGGVTLTDFDVPLEIEPPPADQIVDLG